MLYFKMCPITWGHAGPIIGKQKYRNSFGGWESHFEFRINECTMPTSFHVKHNLESDTRGEVRGENTPRKIFFWHTCIKYLPIFGPLVIFAVIVEVGLLVTVKHSNLTKRNVFRYQEFLYFCLPRIWSCVKF